MPDLLAEVPESDREDLQRRFANFGIDVQSIIAENLVTAPSAITSLNTSPGSVSQLQPLILRTSDFDQVNRWIGVPDEVFDDVAPPVTVPSLGRSTLRRFVEPGAPPLGMGRRASDEQDHLAPFTSTESMEVRQLAKAYLRGDSRVLAKYKGVIERAFPKVEVSLWPLLNVTVKSGSVLEFGPGAHALVAYSLTVENGGVIRSHGNLTISATILRKTKPSIFKDLDVSMLENRRFGQLVFEP